MRGKHVLSNLIQYAGIAENCRLKSQILPNFDTKYEKPKKKKEKFATFCRKNCQILQIKFTNWRTFFFEPGGPEYYIDLKMHTQSHSAKAHVY